MSVLHIRVMQREELDLVIEWAGNEGWNPGLHDAHCYYEADRQGFLVGMLDGEIVGCISAIKYTETFAFIGFYLVKPEFRGLGYGLQIWQAALDYLAGCNIGLDGVTAQQGNYKKSGFKLAYANIRYQGVIDGSKKQADVIEGELSTKYICPLNQLTFSQISDYEKAVFPAERHAFLQQWIEQKDSRALAYLKGDKLMGYGVIRQCLEGYKIAPLFADTLNVASELFLALIATLPLGEHYYLDVPECHQDAVALAIKHEMTPVFETARMYTKDIPKLALNQIYGVTSFEIG